MKDPKLGREIHRLDNLISRQMDREASPDEEIVIGCNTGRILPFLSEHADRDIYPKDLEEAFGITRSTASRVLGLMEQNGFISRESVPHDARLKKLVLTQKGLQLTRHMHQRGQAMDARLLRGFSPEEEKQLFSYLERIRNNLEE